MTKITTVIPGLMIPWKQPLPSEQAAARPSASRRIGKASSTSMKRDRTMSTGPRKKPATMPTTTPIVTENAVAMSATSSETRAP